MHQREYIMVKQSELGFQNSATGTLVLLSLNYESSGPWDG